MKDATGLSVAVVYFAVDPTTASFSKLPTKDRAWAIAQAIVDALAGVFGED